MEEQMVLMGIYPLISFISETECKFIPYKYISMDAFSLKWRFTEDGYNVLPVEDLSKIRPLSKEYSIKFWNQYISKSVKHYMQIDSIGVTENDIVCKDCGWGDGEKEIQSRSLMQERMGLDENELVTFFWNSDVAVETQWGVFLKYWSDFCYSRDDGNILIPHNSDKAIIYVEDILWIVDRERYFGQK